MDFWELRCVRVSRRESHTCHADALALLFVAALLVFAPVGVPCFFSELGSAALFVDFEGARVFARFTTWRCSGVSSVDGSSPTITTGRAFGFIAHV